MKLHALVLCPVIVAVLSGSMLAPKQAATSPAALNKDSVQHTALFSPDDVDRIKQFFLANTALHEQPKDSNWRPGYRHKCINTVRAGLDYLIFGESSIPDSLYSRHSVLNGHENDITALAKKLQEGHFIRS